MEFAPQPQQNISASPDRKIDLPPDRALSYQMVLLMTYFPEIHKGDKDLTDEMISYWTDHYSIAFRRFCDEHPIITQHIIDDRIEVEEAKEMAVYIKSHGATEEETRDINDISKYLH